MLTNGFVRAEEALMKVKHLRAEESERQQRRFDKHETFELSYHLKHLRSEISCAIRQRERDMSSESMVVLNELENFKCNYQLKPKLIFLVAELLTSTFERVPGCSAMRRRKHSLPLHPKSGGRL
mmetsp:Transcript_59535/g.158411  ORF Transcript_59535/g.158411 Transcript_59535/m.158411 type:complete len:124 (+) Transcript_59535:83-454(+)